MELMLSSHPPDERPGLWDVKQTAQVYKTDKFWSHD